MGDYMNDTMPKFSDKITPVRSSDRTAEMLRELDELRARIADGTIVDYALAMVHADRKVGAVWSSTVDKWRLVGAVENLKIDLMAGGK